MRCFWTNDHFANCVLTHIFFLFKRAYHIYVCAKDEHDILSIMQRWSACKLTECSVYF